MEKIESVNNSLIKEIYKLKQKKYRQEQKLFILEGEKALKEALNLNLKIKHIFALENYKNDFNNVIIVNEKVMQKISDTISPPPILAVIEQENHEIKNILNKNKIALFENIKDPGNLGTIIRSASAFSIEAILLYGECIDIYNPKTIRSAAGNFFKVPILKIDNLNEFKNFNIYTTVVKDGKNIKEIKYKEPFIISFGSEATGASDFLINNSSEKITIKTNEKIESLNLSSAASIVFYQIFNN